MSTELQTVNQNASIATESDNASFDFAMKQSEMLSKSTIVPMGFRGNPSNCFIALELAQRMKLSPMAVMAGMWISPQNTPAWYTQFLLAAFNSTGRFSTIEYHEVGQRNTQSWGFYCTTTELATGKELKGSTITIENAKRDGWIDRRGSKWQTIPELMLRYRAAAFLIRQYAPEVAMGIMTREEIEDIEPPKKQMNQTVDLKERLKQKADYVDAEFTTGDSNG